MSISLTQVLFTVCLLLGCSQGVNIKHYFDIDDALDAFGIHAVGGVIGIYLCVAR